MVREDVIARLNSHKPELESLGISHLYLFGSVARGDKASTSDVDLLAEFQPTASIGFAIVSIQHRLEEILGCPVDLVRSPIEKPRLKQVVEREAILAF
ncbi:MAG: nucleotidyltransferase domain-containing protein [Nitrospira sp.]|nr:nucleotidyltransferase domain-containing protein [Nitrospira sp.]